MVEPATPGLQAPKGLARLARKRRSFRHSAVAKFTAIFPWAAAGAEFSIG
jgi:hypothetical protein